MCCDFCWPNTLNAVASLWLLHHAVLDLDRPYSEPHLTYLILDDLPLFRVRDLVVRHLSRVCRSGGEKLSLKPEYTKLRQFRCV